METERVSLREKLSEWDWKENLREIVAYPPMWGVALFIVTITGSLVYVHYENERLKVQKDSVPIKDIKLFVEDRDKSDGKEMPETYLNIGGHIFQPKYIDDKVVLEEKIR